MKKQYSEILKQNIFIDHTAGTVTTEDGAIYNKKEMLFLKNARPEMIAGLHKIKLFFEGEICPDDMKKSVKWL